MNEKLYKAIKNGGACSLVTGILLIVLAVAGGVMLIVNGAKLLSSKSDTLFQKLGRLSIVGIRDYKFTDKKHTIGGVIATAMGIVALIVLLVAIFVSYRNGGKAGISVGNMAFASLMLSFFGTIIGLLSFKEQDKYYNLSYVGSLGCGILTIFYIAIIII